MGQWSNFVSWNCAKDAKGSAECTAVMEEGGALITSNSIA